MDKKPCDQRKADKDRAEVSRRALFKKAATVATAVPVMTSTLALADAHNEHQQPGCGTWRQPDEDDFAKLIGKDKAVFLDRVLMGLEDEQVPLTMEGSPSCLYLGAIGPYCPF